MLLNQSHLLKETWLKISWVFFFIRDNSDKMNNVDYNHLKKASLLLK
ncbi:hypothetical protein KP78_00460 [Jeotgalibacillus soli]|uniref:Uncharacterized protein n=1 Tax=Jeotgalibacillus soli TaxID=889306 RepID=A0A0C2W7H3_9BACL|nr:hypothetical protein KP78_00460 [Jeotgalibacillus soli]